MRDDDEELSRQVFILTERLNVLTKSVERVDKELESLNKLALQGKMAIWVLITLGIGAGWLASQVLTLKQIVRG